MSNKYIEHKVNLTKNQMKNLGNAIKNKKPVTLRISKNNLNGDVPILLTKSQKTNIDKAIQNKAGINLELSNAQLQQLKKHGGFLPLLPLILGGLSAVGSLAAGGSQIAKAVNQAKANERELQETKRHNEMMESKLFSGKGLYKKCTVCQGKGLFLGRSPYKN
jgi:hypothetical protein